MKHCICQHSFLREVFLPSLIKMGLKAVSFQEASRSKAGEKKEEADSDSE